MARRSLLASATNALIVRRFDSGTGCCDRHCNHLASKGSWTVANPRGRPEKARSLAGHKDKQRKGLRTMAVNDNAYAAYLRSQRTTTQAQVDRTTAARDVNDAIP